MRCTEEQELESSLECCKCNSLLEDPRVLCSEEHYICSGCIKKLPTSGTPPVVRCPARTCSISIPVAKLSTLNKPPKVVMSMLTVAHEAQNASSPSAAGAKVGGPRVRIDQVPLGSVLDVLQKGNWKVFQEQVITVCKV